MMSVPLSVPTWQEVQASVLLTIIWKGATGHLNNHEKPLQGVTPQVGGAWPGTCLLG